MCTYLQACLDYLDWVARNWVWTETNRSVLEGYLRTQSQLSQQAEDGTHPWVREVILNQGEGINHSRHHIYTPEILRFLVLFLFVFQFFLGGGNWVFDFWVYLLSLWIESVSERICIHLWQIRVSGRMLLLTPRDYCGHTFGLIHILVLIGNPNIVIHSINVMPH